MERKFAGPLVSRGWEPFVPVMQYGIFASKFPDAGLTLYTFVNRSEYDVGGPQITLPGANGRCYYDAWHGVELKPVERDGSVVLSFQIEAHGSAAVLAVDPGASVADLGIYLKHMNQLTRTPLASHSHEWHFLPQQIVEIPRTKTPGSVPAGMLRIPAGEYEFKVTGIEIEGVDWVGLDVQYPWGAAPRRGHDRVMPMQSYYIDKYPVTNAEFKKFLDASGCKPVDSHNFLRDWKNGAPALGWENKPVTWVALEDARAYAKWAGKRLPHE